MELRWERSGSIYRAVEPHAALVERHAETLRDWYNLPPNAALMGNTVEMTRDDVLEYWAAVSERTARGFLLFLGEELAGDAELRNVTGERAEYSDDEQKPVIAPEPSMQFARETWWDSLLGLYATHHPQLAGNGVLTSSVRDTLAQQVTSDLRFLFSVSNYWFAFINVPRFFSRLLDATTRPRLQPSLIFASSNTRSNDWSLHTKNTSRNSAALTSSNRTRCGHSCRCSQPLRQTRRALRSFYTLTTRDI